MFARPRDRKVSDVDSTDAGAPIRERALTKLERSVSVFGVIAVIQLLSLLQVHFSGIGYVLLMAWTLKGTVVEPVIGQKARRMSTEDIQLMIDRVNMATLGLLLVGLCQLMIARLM